jgi:hypothetical protein
LEGFFLDDKSLSVVGGFNFLTGKNGFLAGDIFIDTTGDIKYGATVPSTIQSANGYYQINNTLGYGFVFDMDYATLTYDVFALTASSKLKTSYYHQNEQANPWRYVSGGELLFSDLSFSYIAGLSDAGIGNGLIGGTHNVISGLDLTFLGMSTTFTVHTAEGCGNDNLMGRATIVPEPMSMMLLGSGLIGIVGLRRKK